MNIEFLNGNTVISDLENLNIAQTLDCGQAFRWNPCGENVWCGIACGTFLKIEQVGNKIILHNTSRSAFENIWRPYFDLDRDYSAVINSLSHNEILSKAANLGSGIRILRQEPWEALCSFIISQNNNIPRIKGIVERLCQNFGEKIVGGYAFPTARQLSVLTPDDLAVIRSGFRAKYILDAARKVANGTIDFSNLSSLSTDRARAELMKIYGVGNKVADCTLLYGMGRLSAFPKDVWINRAVDKLFGGDLPESTGAYAGIIQQYLFYYARETKLDL